MKYYTFFTLSIVLLFMNCTEKNTKKELAVEVYETSANGNNFTKINTKADLYKDAIKIPIQIFPQQKFQKMEGFGGAFTESSAYLLNKLSNKNRMKILEAYFSEKGANYSLTRTHMNSCDFSLTNYSYAPVAEDMELKHFSVKEDKDDLIPMIKDAMKISKDGFRIIASPWTAPKWMKDNQSWVGGKLMKKYYDTWALFFSKYLKAYEAEGIDIWGFTVENEPHGNGNNWESMLYTPEEMTDFVKNHLSTSLKKEGYGHKIILGYDQNREGIKEWADVMYGDKTNAEHYDGMAIHWYESTFDYFPESLEYVHKLAPDKLLLQTEACVDSEVPHWKDDAWYWSKNATDWGWDWAPEHQKHLHPKYVPVYRYARDIIGCMNHWVGGWIDWNMVLNRQGGPNWFKNWCVAPIIVDENADEVYFTPLYYVMMHFSKYIRPNAYRIGYKHTDKDLMVTAAKNKDESIVVVVFNPTEKEKVYDLQVDNIHKTLKINAKALQTVRIKE